MDEFPEEATVEFEPGPLAPEAQTVALAFPHVARSLIICDREALELANAKRNDIRAMKKQVEDCFDPLIEKAHAAHKARAGEKV